MPTRQNRPSACGADGGQEKGRSPTAVSCTQKAGFKASQSGRARRPTAATGWQAKADSRAGCTRLQCAVGARGTNHMGSNPATGPLTGGQICAAAAFSFLLLLRDGTRRAGGLARWFLGPRGWLLMLSLAVPPHSVLLCMHHSSWICLQSNLAGHMGNIPDTWSSLNY